MSASQAGGSSAFSQSAAAIEARHRVSALADGELETAEAHRVIDAVLASPELEAYWTQVHRAGDCLRSEEVAGTGDGGAFLRRFAARFADEPAILASRRDRAARSFPHSWLRVGVPGTSVAAALLVVGWMVMPHDRSDRVRETVAQANIAPAPVSIVPTTAPAAVETVAVQPVDPQQLADYLAAHQQLASSVFRGPSAQAASFATSRFEPEQAAQSR